LEVTSTAVTLVTRRYPPLTRRLEIGLISLVNEAVDPTVGANAVCTALDVDGLRVRMSTLMTTLPAETVTVTSLAVIKTPAAGLLAAWANVAARSLMTVGVKLDTSP